MDICARGLKVTAAMPEDGTLPDFVENLYSGWNSDYCRGMLAGKESLGSVAAKAEGIGPEPRSGKQECLENLVNRFV